MRAAVAPPSRAGSSSHREVRDKRAATEGRLSPRWFERSSKKPLPSGSSRRSNPEASERFRHWEPSAPLTANTPRASWRERLPPGKNLSTGKHFARHHRARPPRRSHCAAMLSDVARLFCFARLSRPCHQAHQRSAISFVCCKCLHESELRNNRNFPLRRRAPSVQGKKSCDSGSETQTCARGKTSACAVS